MATGSYAPKGFAPELRIPQGAEEADGVDSLHPRRPRPDRQRGRLDQGLCRRRHGGRAVRPSFSLEEFKLIVETAKSAGVPVAAHAIVEGGDAAGGAGRASRRSSTATAATPRSSG